MLVSVITVLVATFQDTCDSTHTGTQSVCRKVGPRSVFGPKCRQHMNGMDRTVGLFNRSTRFERHQNWQRKYKYIDTHKAPDSRGCRKYVCRAGL